ncbi:MAG: DUF805 domain-containing protein [Acidimicrobiia bacterium]
MPHWSTARGCLPSLANSAGRSSRHLTVRVRLEPVSFGEAVATCFRKYATFSGRARQSEFWWWILFIVILGGGSAAVAAATGAVDESGNLDPNSGAAALIGIAYLVLILPHLAVSVRRLHDTGRSGWFLLLGFIPCIGAIVLLVFYASTGDPGLNKFGPPPTMTDPS